MVTNNFTSFDDFLYFGDDIEAVFNPIFGYSFLGLQCFSHRFGVVFQNEEGILGGDANQLAALVPVDLAGSYLNSPEEQINYVSVETYCKTLLSDNICGKWSSKAI